MSALAAGFQWLDSVLVPDATLLSYLPGGIHQGMAPLGTALPFGLFSPQSLMDINSATALRIYSNDLFNVKAVGLTSSGVALVNATDRIYTLLNRINATVSRGIILACYREQEYYYTELVNGVQWSHIGGLYRLQIQ